MNKQSSVELFIEQLEEKGNAHIETDGVITVNITIDVNEYRLLIKQAKAMEKKQCVDFALKCMFAHVIPSQATREVVERLFDEDNLQ